MASDGDSTFRSLLVSAGIAGAVAVLVWILTLTPPFQTLEHKASDLLFQIRGPQSLEDSPVVLVTKTQDAYGEIPYDQDPWPRKLYGRLIDNLNEAGARAIGIDVMFDVPRDSASDRVLAQSLREHKNVVLAGRISREDMRQEAADRTQKIKKVGPASLLKEANPNPFGVVTTIPDSDDVLRRYLLFQDYRDQRYYALGLELLRLYAGIDSTEIARTDDHLTWGSRTIPMAQPQSMRINYYGPSDHFPSYSIDKVVDDSTFQTNFERNSGITLNTFNNPDNGLLQRGVFEDKIVLIGSTLPEDHDFHPTPYSGAFGTSAMAGVEVHANALQTMLDQNYLSSMPRSWAWGLILLVALLATVAARRLNIWLSLSLLLLFWGGYFAATIWLFVAHNYMLAITGPVTAALLGYGGSLGHGYVLEQRQKQRIKGMFQSYVSPALVDRMVERGEEPKLGGEQQRITAFFSDIQGFSTISEQLDAPRLVELMNDYLSAMTNIVNEQGGTLDKYIGDAIVAFYGAPVYFDDHAYRACVTSQLMQRELETLRERWKTDGQWPELVHKLRNRIGINTGTMVTGNIGSQRRFNYTVMGDSVNLAARCESGAKSYGAYTMVTEATKEEAEAHGDRCVFRVLDQIVVKGKTEPVRVYEIYGLKDEVDASDRECIELYEEGYEAYLRQDWADARRYLEDAALLEPRQPDEDPGIKTNPSRVLLERCRHLKEDPPGEDWNGVYVMETK